MLPSVRRVAIATSSSASAASAAAAVLVGGQRVVASNKARATDRPQRQHQRRYSSSKPSNSDGSGSGSLPSSSSSSSPSSTSSSTPKRRRKTSKTDASSSSAAAAAVAATPASTSARASSTAANAAAASSAAAAAVKLPSVPSTQHLPIESLALSAFFSQHRPISVTHSLPKIVTDDAFAAIFAQAPPSSSRRAGRGAAGGQHRASDVIRTLTKTVHDLEGPMAALTVSGKGDTRRTSAKKAQQQEAAAAMARRQELLQQLEEDNDSAAASSSSASSPSSSSASSASSSRSPTIEFKHADGSDSGISVQLQALAGQLLPFQPPPAPVAEEMGEDGEFAGADLMGSGAAADEGVFADDAEITTTRVFKAVLMIEEQRDAQGQVRIVAHTPQIVEDGDEEGEMMLVGGGSNNGSGRRVGHGHGSSRRAAAPRSFLERMALRQLRYEDAMGHWQAPRMEALSVKRQRKLKMKKKKYKKLMRRTRTLRRRQDRA